MHAVASELGQAGNLQHSTYAAAHELLGDTGMVELISLCGYYTLVSFLLDGFEVPVPPDVRPQWESV